MMVYFVALRRLAIVCLCLLLSFTSSLAAVPVRVGIDNLFLESYRAKLQKKRIGIITNQTAVNADLRTTLDILKANAKDYKIAAIFAPEHGLYGRVYADENVEHDKDLDGIPIYSLYGPTRRPTEAMLKGIDLLIYDIQDIGSRSYTYITTLFYVMEEAAKYKIPVLVLDRPNPINGITIDGPMLEEPLRSMVGYINVPYCYGMTIGELANFFNQEYKVGCELDVIPMRGWLRSMSFRDTGLPWIPTSPYIPEPDTPLYYPITGTLGELSLVNIGIGYTLPFKLVGAPWINAIQFAKALNDQKFPGVYFTPFYYRPFYGKFKNEDLQGVLISVSNPMKYKPLAIQFLIIGTLKRLYPTHFEEGVKNNTKRKEMFSKVLGSSKAWNLLLEKRNLILELRAINEVERRTFYEKRKKYLNPAYSGQG